jgi:hypothetical protein
MPLARAAFYAAQQQEAFFFFFFSGYWEKSGKMSFGFGQTSQAHNPNKDVEVTSPREFLVRSRCCRLLTP